MQLNNLKNHFEFALGNPSWLVSDRIQKLNARSCHLYYVYADYINSGDFASHLGVRFLANTQGVNIRCFEASQYLFQNGSNTRLLIGGGGLLQPCFEPFWKKVVDRKIQYALFGVGINQLGSIRKEMKGLLLKKIAANAFSIHVRDEYTAEILRNMGAKSVSVGICPSVNYLRSDRFQSRSKSKHLLHVIHPADLHIANVNTDKLRSHLRKISLGLNLGYKETVHLEGLSPRLIRKYENAAIVITSRLHGCIFSSAFKKPFIALGTDVKTTNYLTCHHPQALTYPASEAAGRITADIIKQQLTIGPIPVSDYEIQKNKNRMNELMELWK